MSIPIERSILDCLYLTISFYSPMGSVGTPPSSLFNLDMRSHKTVYFDMKDIVETCVNTLESYCNAGMLRGK